MEEKGDRKKSSTTLSANCSLSQLYTSKKHQWNLQVYKRPQQKYDTEASNIIKQKQTES